MPKFPDKIGQWAAILGVSLLLHACAGDAPVPPKSAPKPSRKPAPPLLRPVAPLPAPRIQPSPGLEGVIGANAAELTKQFGPPRLDVSEGDARKLQFTGIPCVLDIYLYPPIAGKPPLASYVAARRSDGRDVDRVACVMALRKK
jgi:hypothetical protein